MTLKLILCLLFVSYIKCGEHVNSLIDDDRIIDNDPRRNMIPQQIHLALGETPSEMVVMWSTRWETLQSFVWYGPEEHKMDRRVKGYETLLDNQGTHQYVHTVTLTDLEPNTTYVYKCGSNLGWSEEFFFRTFPPENDTTWVPKICIYGDLGIENGRSILSLLGFAENKLFDMIIHIGDIAYQLYSNNGEIGDTFMHSLQRAVATVPFMTVPGNHEYYDSDVEVDLGINYRTRFKMPNSFENRWYTFTAGPILFVGFSTEVYFSYENSSVAIAHLQRQWLEEVLAEANKPENRAKHPWVIGLGHRSIYCSTTDWDCIRGMTIDYGDIGQNGLIELEKILHRGGVDIAFWGHYHYYDRFYPVFNRTLMCDLKDPYRNPRATVHILSGAAGMTFSDLQGMQGALEGLRNPPPPFTAFRAGTEKYGFSRIWAYNATHIYLEEYDVEHDNEVIDSVWIIQENHGPRSLP